MPVLFCLRISPPKLFIQTSSGTIWANTENGAVGLTTLKSKAIIYGPPARKPFIKYRNRKGVAKKRGERNK